jgi:hypothetical protein
VICQIKCPFGSGYGSKGDGTVYGKKHQDEFIQMRSPVSVAEFMENSRRVVEVLHRNRRHFLLVSCPFYHKPSALTHISCHESKKHEASLFISSSSSQDGAKDTLWFLNWTNNTDMRQNAGFHYTVRLL